MKVLEVPIPALSLRQVLVRVHYSLINAGTESSTVKAARTGFLGPFVPGHVRDALRRADEAEPLFLGNAIAFWDEEKRKLIASGRPFDMASGFIKELSEGLAATYSLLRLINIELRNRLPELLL